jgi:hypothetical protein
MSSVPRMSGSSSSMFSMMESPLREFAFYAAKKGVLETLLKLEAASLKNLNLKVPVLVVSWKKTNGK